MHFVTGGAFNGKSAWVKSHYQNEQMEWISAYEAETIPERLNAEFVVLEGVELWIKTLIDDQFREIWRKQLDGWKTWEQENEVRQLILIGTDITKGIVPVDARDREWRDAVGWAFQDVAACADRVDLVWYGLNKRLK